MCGFWCERQQGMDFFHRWKPYYGLWTYIWNKSNNLDAQWCICFFQTCGFCLLKMLTDGLEWCGLLWCFHQLFGLILTCLQIWRRSKLIYILDAWRHQIKSNQITFIVTSPQHKCLGEWNSYERAPDSAKKNKKKQQQQFTYGQTVQKNNKLFTYGQTVQKNNKQFTYGQTVQKNNKLFTYGQTVQKNNKQFTYGQTVQKNNKQFTYGQTVQKNNKLFTYGQTVQKSCTGAFTVLQTVQKKQQQFTYGQYIFTDYTEDNVQNTHTYTQYT